jgi:bifunctional non-homologous end joining protein LigD
LLHRSLHSVSRSQAPTGPGWVHEIKHDGYRLIVRRDRSAVRLFTRRGHDWTARYPAVAGAAAKLRAKSFRIDGEAVVCGPDGVALFDALHQRWKAPDAMLYAFDLLEFDGADLRPLPLGERKARLMTLLWRRSDEIVLNEHTDEDGATVFRHARGQRIETARGAVPVRPLPGLAQGQEPGQRGDGSSARFGRYCRMGGKARAETLGRSGARKSRVKPLKN